MYRTIHFHTHSGINTPTTAELDEVELTAAHCLKLPGKSLNLTALLYAKKFRGHGYKTGAQAAFKRLVQDGLGEQVPPIHQEGTGKCKKVDRS